MSENKRMTIEIPADVMAEVATEARKLERFSGLSDAEIVEAVLTAGASKITETQLKTRAKAHGMMIRKDGKGGYLLTDFNNCLMAPGPMTLEEVALWLDDLNKPQAQQKN